MAPDAAVHVYVGVAVASDPFGLVVTGAAGGPFADCALTTIDEAALHGVVAAEVVAFTNQLYALLFASGDAGVTAQVPPPAHPACAAV